MRERLRLLASTLLVLLAVALVSACASDPYDEPPPVRDRGGMEGGFQGDPRGEGMRAAEGGQGGLDGLPPSTWWRDPRISTAVNLTSEQFAALDKIGQEQGEEIDRLQRDVPVAARQLREALEADPARSDEIIAAGQRLRAMRDDILERQVKMIAAERVVLSRQQWTALQSALQADRRDRRQERGNRPRGRGEWGGGMGRRPFPR